MFSLPLGLPLGTDETPQPLRRAFAPIRDVFPDANGTRAELAWSMLHGIATLQAGGRLRANYAEARFDLAYRRLSQERTH